MSSSIQEGDNDLDVDEYLKSCLDELDFDSFEANDDGGGIDEVLIEVNPSQTPVSFLDHDDDEGVGETGHSEKDANEMREKVTDKARAANTEFVTAMTDIEKHRGSLHELGATELNIATMTIMGHLSLKHINLLKIVFFFDRKREELLKVFERKGVIFTELIHPESMNTHVNQNQKKRAKKTFQNSIILKYVESDPNMNRKAIKIFCNGALHVNGCKCVEEFMRVCEIVCSVLNFICKLGDAPEKDKFALKDFNVQLVNTNMMIRYTLSLPRVYKHFTADYPDIMKCDYDAEFHPAVMIKHAVLKREVTILIFNTGHVIITGVIDARELVESYRFVTSFLERHIHEIKVDLSSKKQTKKCGGRRQLTVTENGGVDDGNQKRRNVKKDNNGGGKKKERPDKRKRDDIMSRENDIITDDDFHCDRDKKSRKYSRKKMKVVTAHGMTIFA